MTGADAIGSATKIARAGRSRGRDPRRERLRPPRAASARTREVRSAAAVPATSRALDRHDGRGTGCVRGVDPRRRAAQAVCTS